MTRPLTALEQQFFAAPDRASWKDLLDAVAAGDATKVAGLLAADPALCRARDPSGVSALLLAVYHGQREIVDLLAGRAAGEVDLFEAAAMGDGARVAALLDSGLDADPALRDAKSPDGFPLLGLAAYFGHPTIVEDLLERGADPAAAAANATRVTPLHGAVAHRDAERAFALARRLLDAGAPVDALQAGGFTPLHAAAGRGHRELVSLLLERGADPTIESDGGKTARDLAVERGHAEVAALLA